MGSEMCIRDRANGDRVPYKRYYESREPLHMFLDIFGFYYTLKDHYDQLNASDHDNTKISVTHLKEFTKVLFTREEFQDDAHLFDPHFDYGDRRYPVTPNRMTQHERYQSLLYALNDGRDPSRALKQTYK